MLYSIYIVFVLALVENSSSRGVSEETQEVLLKLVADQPNSELVQPQSKPGETGVKFKCLVSKEESSPSSVHALRPEDIDVVGAIGDSYTAAFGAGASFLGPIAFLEHRGLSFSVGGDETLETHVSIPNIIKKFNPNVYGFSVGTSQTIDKSKMNVAVTGATSEDLLDMVDELIERFVDDPLVNMEEDWKMITVFIGGNDVFDSCLQPRFEPEKFKEILIEAFNTMKAMIPRAFVNVIPIPDITELKKMKGVVCDVVHMAMCPCLYAGKDSVENIANMGKEYGKILEELASSGDFDTDDFALVFQPGPAKAYVPVAEDGTADTSYFAPDCLHLSKLGHATGAYYLWANMLEPVNAKVTKWAPTMEEYLPCTSSPYLYTNRNSVTISKSGGVSSNQQISSTTTDSESLGGGVIAAIVFLVCSLAFISGYAIYRQIHKTRLSYQSL